MSDWGFETRQIHAGAEPDPTTGARAVPIYQTTSFVFRDTEHAAALFGLAELGNIYTRIMNPTQAVFEDRVAALEGGVGALGDRERPGRADDRAAQPRRERRPHRRERVALRRHVQPAALHVPEARRRGQLHRRPRRPRRVEGGDPAEHAGVLRREHRQPEGRHPRLRRHRRRRARREDPARHRQHARERRTCCNPLQWGADIVVHSATKFIGGHGTSIGGIIVDGGKFDYVASGRFANFTEPDPSYHGLVFSELPEPLRPAQYILKARLQYQRDIGAAVSPFNSFLFLQGLETLSLRMERHSQNALAVAQWLEARDEVEWVAYPGPRVEPVERPGEEVPAARARARSSRSASRVGSRRASASSTASSCISHLANVGDVRSLAIHPASTTHQQLDVGGAVRDRRHARPRAPLGRHRVDRRHPRRPRGGLPGRQGRVA